MPIVQALKDSWKDILMALISAGFIGQLVGVWDITMKREDDYIHKYIECQEATIALNRKEDRVMNMLNTIELMRPESPFAEWNKDRYGTITYINAEYKRLLLDPIGVSPVDFLNTKGEALGKDFVKMVLPNDVKVMSERRMIKFPETVPRYGDGVSYKYPLYNDFRDVIGTGGMWIPYDKL